MVRYTSVLKERLLSQAKAELLADAHEKPSLRLFLANHNRGTTKSFNLPPETSRHLLSAPAEAKEETLENESTKVLYMDRQFSARSCAKTDHWIGTA